MSKINVLVTGIGGGGHGEQILKALKLIKNNELFIIGTDITEFTTGKLLVDKFYKVPPVSISPESFKETITEIINKHKIKILFHGSEPELRFFSENRNFFESLGVKLPINSKEVISICMNKLETFFILESKGIKVPKYCGIKKIEDIQKINFYPVVLKPSIGSGGTRNVYIAIDEEECFLLVRYMLKQGLSIVAQEYIGDSENEYTIGVTSIENGEILGSIIIKRYITNTLTTHSRKSYKNEMLILSTGISQGEIINDKSLQEQAEYIAKVLNSKGPLNIQCRKINGQLMIMEINPRFSGTTSIRALAGYNEPEIYINFYLCGKKIKPNTKYGLIILRTINEIILL